MAVRPGTLRALATSDEHATLFFTDATDTCAPGAPAGAGDAPHLRRAGAGRPRSAARSTVLDCTLLAQRSSSGRVAFAAYPTEQESAGAWWTESGPQLPADARCRWATTTRAGSRPPPPPVHGHCSSPAARGAGPGAGGLADG